MSARRATFAALALALAWVASAHAMAPDDGVAFAPRVGVALPADAAFMDDDGAPVLLGRLVAGRPALVVLGYYGCANLCSAVLNGLAAGLDGTGLRAGEDFDVVVISVAPLETPADARTKKRATLDRTTPAREPRGWHFLTGDEATIDRVADALGARYRFDAATAQYAHAAGVTLIAPGGCIRGVLYGVAFAPETLRDGLREAAAGRCQEEVVASRGVTGEPSVERWLLCFHYDPHTGRYSVAAMEAVRLGGLLSLLALGGSTLRAWRRERRRP